MVAWEGWRSWPVRTPTGLGRCEVGAGTGTAAGVGRLSSEEEEEDWQMALERTGSRSQKSAREVSRPKNSSLLLASALFFKLL